MKNNAHLDWPPSVMDEYLASISAPKAQADQQPVASVERLAGGCLLYQPTQWSR